MLKNYLKITFRNLIRRKSYSLINIFGLAVGMACTILILLWVRDELSYDSFHKNADNIYLVLRGDNGGTMAVTSKMLAPEIKKDLPEIKNSTYYIPLPEAYKFLIRSGNNAFDENVMVAADNFFSFFSFPFKAGAPETALSEPNSIVIDEYTAQKYFGSDNPVGKQLDISAFGLKSLMRVSAVLKNIPPQSEIREHVIIPESWLKLFGMNRYFDRWDQQSFQTFIELKSNVDIAALNTKILSCEIKNFPKQDVHSLSYSLLPLTKIHLYGNDIKFLDSTGDIKYVRIFIAIALIILLIASINYMNLTTALSLKRAKEVGIRKTVGADRKALIFQFFGEGLIISFIALLLAMLIVELFLPEFNHIAGKNIVLRYDNLYFIGILLLVTITTGLISVSYPALLLSSFIPAQIFRGKLAVNSGKLIIRRGLVIFQFSLSITIIICTIVVFSQMSFIRSSSLGFDKENVICIRIAGDANSRFSSLKQELLKNPEITNVSRSQQIGGSNLGRTDGVNWPGRPADEKISFVTLVSDFDLADTYGFEMAQGRYYSDQYPSDTANALVVNQTAVKAMKLKSPVGEEVFVWGKQRRIIGVIKDFHFASFHSPVEPLLVMLPGKYMGNLPLTTISLRFHSAEPEKILAGLEKTWKEQLPGTPFDFYFFDESINAQYSSEQRMSSVFRYFSFLSILISCLGLFGLASLSAGQRTKEIGIRKVLGASVSGISLLLSREFMLWVVLSNIIAFPAAWYFMNSWLQDFAYRTSIQWWMFALAGGIALLIAVITVGLQALKAASANPVDSLKYE